jgi:hypothetical protein
MSNELPVFVETLEYKRFVEFCEACRRDCYIGLSYGPPGVGKTRFALHHSRIQKIVPIDRWSAEASDDMSITTVFFTPDVINTPGRIDNEIRVAGLLSRVSPRERLTPSKEQRSMFYAAETRLGLSSTVGIATTDQITLLR